MKTSRVAHKSDPILTRDLHAVVGTNRDGFSCELEHIAEFHARKLFLAAAHPTMQSYLVHELQFTPASARKRIHAAGTARQYPVIFEMISEGRLHLSAVILLAPSLTTENADELLAAAAGRSKTEIDQLLAERSGRLDQPMLPPVAESDDFTEGDGEQGEKEMEPCAPGRMDSEPVTAAMTPVPAAPARAPWPITVDPADHAVLKEAQALLRHQIPTGDMTKVLSRLIALGFAQLQKQRNGTGVRTRAPRRPSANPRHLPTAVKQAVWERDGGQCTFTSESGHRCPAREFIEFDHAEPVARGGIATIANIRLRCRAHNQYAAEQAFGREFMAARREAAASRTRRRTSEPPAADPPHVADVIPWLRGLGFKIDEARRAAGACRNMPEAPLEERVRAALRSFRQKPIACGGMIAG